MSFQMTFINIPGELSKIRTVSFIGSMVTKILSDLHPSLALADYVKDIKISTSVWIKNSGKFPNFDGWAEGYATFTVSHNDRNRIIEYIKGQKEHHKTEVFKDEYKRLLEEYGIEFDEKYIQ